MLLIDNDAGAIVHGHTLPLHDLPYGIVDAQYLSTFGIPILEGRGFGSGDWEGGSFTIIVNQTLARRVWPGQSAIGQRLIIAGIPRTVIGVARDTKYATLDEPQSSYAFLPVAQAYMPMMNIYVHPRNTGVNVDLIVREEASRVNPSIVVQTPVAFDRKVALQLLPQRLAASFIGMLGAVGLLLGCVGLYALVAQQVALRTREFGIRLALGAPPTSILALVLRRTAVIVGTGVAIGVVLSLALGQLSRGLLLGVSPSEPVTVVLPALMMAAVCVVASYVPARRAIRLDPVRSLQET